MSAVNEYIWTRNDICSCSQGSFTSEAAAITIIIVHTSIRAFTNLCWYPLHTERWARRMASGAAALWRGALRRGQVPERALAADYMRV
eukprot:6187647-Pleurochrysis_carterae.AAC.2